MKRHLEGLILAAVALFVACQILIPPAIGLADNGDYPRITGRFSLKAVVPEGGDPRYEYFRPEYVVDPAAHWASGYISSEFVLVAPAVASGLLFSKTFHLQWLGALHLLVFLGAVWLVLRASRDLGWPLRLALAVLLLVVFCDAGFIAYFNSFYSEPSSYIFALGFVGAGLCLADRRCRVALAAPAFAISALMFVAAKPQNAPLGALVALCCAWLAWWCGLGWRRRAFAISGALVFLVSLLYYRATPAYLNRHYLFHAVFFELLWYSPTPYRDLQELGLDPALMRLQGRHVFSPESPSMDDPAFQRQFFDRIGPGKLVRFYLRHPGRLIAALERGSSAALTLRPDYLGNFQRSAGQPPGARTQSFSAWSAFKEHALPQHLWFLVAVLAAAAALGGRLISQHGPASMPGAAGALLITTALMAGEQFVSSIIGSGLFEAAKHLFLFQVLFDCCACALLLWAVARIARTAAAPRRLPKMD